MRGWFPVAMTAKAGKGGYRRTEHPTAIRLWPRAGGTWSPSFRTRSQRRWLAPHAGQSTRQLAAVFFSGGGVSRIREPWRDSQQQPQSFHSPRFQQMDQTADSAFIRTPITLKLAFVRAYFSRGGITSEQSGKVPSEPLSDEATCTGRFQGGNLDYLGATTGKWQINVLEILWSAGRSVMGVWAVKNCLNTASGSQISELIVSLMGVSVISNIICFQKTVDEGTHIGASCVLIMGQQVSCHRKH